MKLLVQFPFIDIVVEIFGEDNFVGETRKFFGQFIKTTHGDNSDSPWIVESQLLKKFSEPREKKTRDTPIYRNKIANVSENRKGIRLWFDATQLRIHGKHITVSSVDESELKLQTFAMVRAIMEYEYLTHGFGLFHCAAIEVYNKGWLICGRKGTGKTTILLRLVTHGATYVANDRAFIGLRSGSLVVVPRPSRIRIGMGTALQHKQLRSLVSQEYKKMTNKELYNPNLPKITFAYLPDAIGCTAKNSTFIAGVLFPNLQETGMTTKTSVADGTARLRWSALRSFPGLQLAQSIFGKLPDNHREILQSSCVRQLQFHLIHDSKHKSLLKLLRREI
ncbi:MAG: hypothetical protein Q7K40_00020 [bacterium]|nr:hypothetical protein [bacterium]